MNLKDFLPFFKKPDLQQLDAFYPSLGTNHYSWMAFAVNQRILKESLLTKELALSSDTKGAFSWQVAEDSEGIFHSVASGKKRICETKLKNSDEKNRVSQNFNSLLDRLIQEHLDLFKNDFEKGTLSLRQLEAEEKALEWIRVSFEVLKKAVLESLTNPDFLFQTSLFAGINPQTNKREIRVIAFNLDMTFILLDDHNLRVLIYNKKPDIPLEELKPALMGDYSARKREILDQLTILMAVLSKGFHL